MDADAPLKKGQILEGKYEILGPLGAGAMGVVFEAQHRLLDKRVAIKVLRAEWASDDDVRGRFEAEARAAAALGHPHIISVTDMGLTDDGALYFVMDRLKGETLGERLRRKGRLDVGPAAIIADEILDGLEAAHALGLVHRDLKPDNVFLALGPGGREAAKILDFGVAKAQAAVARRTSGGGTQVGVAIGTPEYMAPEQARGDADVDARADLYAVGVILYRMLSGRLPFEGESALIVMTRLLLETAPPLRSLAPTVPPDLALLVEAAMSRDRERRPPTAAELRRRLAAALPGHDASPSVLAAHAPSGLATTPDAFALPDRLSLAGLDGTPLAPLPAEPTLPDAPPTPALAPGDASRPGGTAATFLAPPVRPAGPPPTELETSPDTPLTLARAPAAKPDAPAGPPDAAARDVAAHEWVTRPAAEGGGGVRALVTWVLILGVLGGLGYGGWRFRSSLPFIGDSDDPDKPAVYQALPADDGVTIWIDVQPKGADLLLDGAPAPSNPLRLPRSPEPHKISGLANGFAGASVEFVADQAKTVKLRLKRR